MKRLTNILKNMIADRIIAVTSLVSLMLCVSIVAQADYFMYSNNDDFTTWTDNAVASGSSPTFSISFNATTGRNYFVAYTGASANYANISTSTSVSVTNSGCSTCSNVQRQERGNPKRYYALFSVSSASTVTVTFNTSTLAYTVTTAASYTITGSGNHCTFDPTSQSIASGGSGTFTVTPEPGYRLVSASVTNASCLPENLENATTAKTVTVSNPTAAGTLTVVTAYSGPIVRIGKQLKELTEGGDKGKVRVNGYVAATNCSDVTKITVYYSNNSSFRNKDNNKAYSYEHTLATRVTANNNVTENINLTQAQVAQVVGKGETLYVRITATNAADETSAYSDVVSLVYNNDQFVVEQPFSQSVKACKGEHKFKWTGEDGLFNPRPSNYTVKFNNSSGDDASSEFDIDGDYMVWTGATKYSYDDDGEHAHVYYFTATKEESRYTPANATITLNLKAQKLVNEMVTIKDGAGSAEVTDVSVEPWTLLKLTATKTGGSAIEWKAPEGLLMTVEDDGATVYIKGTQASGVAYTVTARPVTATCGASTPTEVKIKVDVVAETCTNN